MLSLIVVFQKLSFYVLGGALYTCIRVKQIIGFAFIQFSRFMCVLKGSITKCTVAKLMLQFESVAPRKYDCAASGVRHAAL